MRVPLPEFEVEKTDDGVNDGATDGATKGVKEKLSALLKAIAANEGKRAPDYTKVVDVSERTMERYLQQLKKAALVEFKGDAPQTGGYYLTKKMKAKLKR
jgi:ATP-dependent DNA helicase RecG